MFLIMEALRLLLQAGVMAGVFSVITLWLSNRHAAQISAQNARDQRDLAQLTADRELKLEQVRLASNTSQREYEERRDALLEFQDAVVDAMGLIRQQHVAGFDAHEVNLTKAERARFRAIAFSSPETAEIAVELHDDLMAFAMSYPAHEKLEADLRRWSRAVHQELTLALEVDA
ncbi:hypothetical protein AAEX63_01795 [Luteococcus sp. H138]|uniref:hypothetical protein n=1 Tax=Luteococcus sp. H138 TaxID=3139404 RepID=UPI00313AFDBF